MVAKLKLVDVGATTILAVNVDSVAALEAELGWDKPIPLTKATVVDGVRRRLRAMSVKDRKAFAEEHGINYSSLHAVTYGRYMPGIEMLQDVINALGMTVDIATYELKI